MWVSKWLMAAAVLGEDVTPYISEHISERIGSRGSTGLIEFLFDTLRLNISNLFPIGYREPGLIAAILIMLALAYILFVYRRCRSLRKLIT